MLAAYYGYPERATLLIDKGVDINKKCFGLSLVILLRSRTLSVKAREKARSARQ